MTKTPEKDISSKVVDANLTKEDFTEIIPVGKCGMKKNSSEIIPIYSEKYSDLASKSRPLIGRFGSFVVCDLALKGRVNTLKAIGYVDWIHRDYPTYIQAVIYPMLEPNTIYFFEDICKAVCQNFYTIGQLYFIKHGRNKDFSDVSGNVFEGRDWLLDMVKAVIYKRDFEEKISEN